jgi:hypothetical protein
MATPTITIRLPVTVKQRLDRLARRTLRSRSYLAIAADNPKLPGACHGGFVMRCANFPDIPTLGALDGCLARGNWSSPVRHTLVPYIVHRDQLAVLTVLHGAQEWPK